MPPKVIIFDLLTALLDSWTLWDESAGGDALPWRSRYLEITFAAGKYVPYENFVRQAASDVGLPPSVPEKLIQNWNKLQPWPEVPSVLRQLKDKGYKLGVVTNCSKKMGNIAADRAGEGMFDAVVTAEESGFYKPVKEAYMAILDKMGVTAEEALFVAGSAGDVQGATNAGMKVVWNNHVGLKPKGEAVPLREGRTMDDALRDYL